MDKNGDNQFDVDEFTDFVTRSSKLAEAGKAAEAKKAAEAVAKARQVFQDADKNKNGFLTKSEIRKYFKKHPAEKNRILGSDFQWNEFFTNMDKNGDNKFDVNEFTDYLLRSSTVSWRARRKKRQQSQMIWQRLLLSPRWKAWPRL